MDKIIRSLLLAAALLVGGLTTTSMAQSNLPAPARKPYPCYGAEIRAVAKDMWSREPAIRAYMREFPEDSAAMTSEVCFEVRLYNSVIDPEVANPLEGTGVFERLQAGADYFQCDCDEMQLFAALWVGYGRTVEAKEDARRKAHLVATQRRR